MYAHEHFLRYFLLLLRKQMCTKAILQVLCNHRFMSNIATGFHTCHDADMICRPTTSKCSSSPRLSWLSVLSKHHVRLVQSRPHLVSWVCNHHHTSQCMSRHMHHLLVAIFDCAHCSPLPICCLCSSIHSSLCHTCLVASGLALFVASSQHCCTPHSMLRSQACCCNIGALLGVGAAAAKE